jgi:hypothetical protein
MPAAGETIIAGKIPGERVATSTESADSANVTTTETTVQSVTAALVSGRTYRVRWAGRLSSSVATDTFVGRIREDNATGTELASWQTDSNLPATLGLAGVIEAEYTAGATANKTFVLAIVRSAGSGNGRLEAAATRPAYLYVDYISG